MKFQIPQEILEFIRIESRISKIFLFTLFLGVQYNYFFSYLLEDITQERLKRQRIVFGTSSQKNSSNLSLYNLKSEESEILSAKVREVLIPFKNLGVNRNIKIGLKIGDCEFVNSLQEGWLSGVFDSEWYYQKYPDVKKAGMDAWFHYTSFGWREGRKNHPYFKFDARWYKNKYLSKDNPISPLLHYILWGITEGNLPSSKSKSIKFFIQLHSKKGDCQLEKGSRAKVQIETSGSKWIEDFFSPDFYSLSYPNIKADRIDPWEHFNQYGWKEGRFPNPLFLKLQEEYRNILDQNLSKESFFSEISKLHIKHNDIFFSKILDQVNLEDSIELIFQTVEEKKTNRLSLISWIWGSANEMVLPILILSTLTINLVFILLLFHANYYSILLIPLLFFSFSLIHCIINPPFFAPDEEYHFGSFTQITSNSHWHQEASEEASRVHLGRLQFQANERIDTFTKESPYPITVRKGIDEKERSIFAFYTWKLFSKILPSSTVIESLLFLRIFHSMIWYLFIFIGMYFLQKMNIKNYKIISFSTFLLVPVLPHFASMISDYALVTSLGFLTFAIFSCYWFQETFTKPAYGLFLGVVSSLWLMSPTSAIFIMIPISILIVIMLSKNSINYFLKFCLLFFTPIIITYFFIGIPTSFYDDAVILKSKIIDPVSTTNLPKFSLIEIITDKLKLLINWGFSPPPIPNSASFNYKLSSFDLSILTVLHLPYLLLPVVQDHLLSKTYWVGFGWQEMSIIYPDQNIQFIISFLFIGIMYLIYKKSWKDLSIILFGFLIILPTVIFSPIVQGRYLIVGYFFVIGGAAFGLFKLLYNKRIPYIILFFSFLSIGFNSIWWVIYRYYG